MGGSGGGGGGNTTTVQKADPWAGVQPYLKDAYANLSQLYNGPGPQYYPGQAVSSPSSLEQAGANNLLSQVAAMNAAGQRAYTYNAQLGNLGNQAAAAGGNMAAANAQSARGLAYGLDDSLGAAQHAASSLSQYGDANSRAGANMAMGNAQSLRELGNSAAGGSGLMQGAASQLNNYGQANTAAGASGVSSAMQQLNQAGDFNNNPAYQAALQSAIRPVTQQFQEQVMPGIKQGAMDAGQLGSSRQGIAEGIASRGYMDTVGDISANMGNAAYAQGLQALQASGQLGQNLANSGLGATNSAGGFGSNLANLQAGAYGSSGALGTNVASGALGASANAGQLSAGLTNTAAGLYSGLAGLGVNQQQNGMTALGQQQALAPTVQQGLTAGSQLQYGLGQQATADRQAQINAAMQQYNYNQNLPYTMASDYLQMLQGAPGGQTMSSQSGGGGNRLTGALGGAATGAALGSAFPGIGTGIGAGVGALYGLFM